MKSRFFTDTRELDNPFRPRDKICVCLCLNRRACEQLLREAARLGVTSGEYVERLLREGPSSRGDTEVPDRSCTPWPRLPPAPPGR